MFFTSELTAYLVSLRMDVANPAKLNQMVKGYLQSAGLDEASVAQVND